MQIKVQERHIVKTDIRQFV